MGKVTSPFLGIYLRNFMVLAAFTVLAACSGPRELGAAPYAAYVMDARTGETLYSENAETRLHPASLTKMMTLYIAFQEIEAGNISLDTMVTVSKNAAAQPPSRLGLKAGQKIQLRYLIRAAAVKSANDAAAAIGDHISGSKEKFAARMTKTAKSLGMKNTTFKNANGLTAKGHLSTAHDMSILGRRVFYDFPQYYNIFSRRTTDAGIAEVANTNRRFLDAYEGADGIKTGYTEPAGFNLTASAQRNGVRIIATVFGGKSTADRNAKVSKLLDLGFKKAPANANGAPTNLPDPSNADEEMIASGDGALPEIEGGAAKTVRVVMAVNVSPRPMMRPDHSEAVEEMVASMETGIDGALAEALAPEPEPGTLEHQALALADGEPSAVDEGVELAMAEPEVPLQVTAKAVATTPVALVAATPRPAKRKAAIYDSTAVVADNVEQVQGEVITTISTSDGASWGVNIGRFGSRDAAQRALVKMQLAESTILGQGLRKIVEKSGGFDGNFMGLGQRQAEQACVALQARGLQCFAIGP